MDWANIVGRNVRRLRNSRNATQEDVAFDAGMDVLYLRMIEKGRANPSLKKLIGICNALDVHPRELFRAVK